jgi:3-deoxy-manno-octulosonate cytidylyltransferase (CMP-KDO synthetase)
VGRLEGCEGLEQLRFMENGTAVQCVEVDGRGRPFWELNNPSDVPKIEAMLARRSSFYGFSRRCQRVKP